MSQKGRKNLRTYQVVIRNKNKKYNFPTVKIFQYFIFMNLIKKLLWDTFAYLKLGKLELPSEIKK